MLGDEALHFAQRLAIGSLRFEMRAELRLVAGAPQKQHQLASDRERQLPAEVFFDQRKREIDAGGDAGGRVHVAVTHEDRLAFDPHRGIAVGEPLATRPVRRRAPAVE